MAVRTSMLGAIAMVVLALSGFVAAGGPQMVADALGADASGHPGAGTNGVPPGPTAWLGDEAPYGPPTWLNESEPRGPPSWLVIP